MADVVRLPPRGEDQVVWRCNCGCMSFFARADGELECGQCSALVATDLGDWRKRLKDVPADVQDVGAGDVSVVDLNSSPAALQRTLGKADAETTAAVMIFQTDGSVSTWGTDVETDEQFAWLDRRFDTAKEMLRKKRPADVDHR